MVLRAGYYKATSGFKVSVRLPLPSLIYPEFRYNLGGVYLMRIPVGVEDDDGVCALQVEAEPAGARGQQEHEVVRVGVVELLEQLATVFRFCHAVQSGRYMWYLICVTWC